VGENIRVDDAFEEGMEIPIYYDPMIAKLVVWGEDRAQAIAKMIDAIDSYKVSGIKHNLDFCKYVLKHKAFISGDFDTNFVKHYFHSPQVVLEGLNEEKEVFENTFDQIWIDLKKRNEKEFISRPIHGAWKLMVR
jgi:acetyl/propionyl-CoA carboxylase alpha subunit